MASHADITAAPFEIHLDGQKYKATPLTGDDLGEIEEWAKARVMSVAYKALDSNPDLSESNRTLIVDRALHHVGRMSFTQESEPGNPSELERILSTIKGQQLILWIACRTHQPELKASDMGSSSVLNLIHEQVAVLWDKSGFAVEIEEDPADAAKKRRAKKKAAKARSKKRRARKSGSR